MPDFWRRQLCIKSDFRGAQKGEEPQKMVWLGREGDLLLWSGIFSAAKCEKSSVFRKRRESDVGQHHTGVLFYLWTKQEKHHLFCKEGGSSLLFWERSLHFSFTTWLQCMDASRAGSKFSSTGEWNYIVILSSVVVCRYCQLTTTYLKSVLSVSQISPNKSPEDCNTLSWHHTWQHNITHLCCFIKLSIHTMQ